MTLSAIGMVLGFAGYGIWPLAFIAFLPALFVVDPRQSGDPAQGDEGRVRGGFERPVGWRWFRRALFFGYLAELGGFGFLIHTLVTFSGFPWIACLAIASIFFAFQGLQFVMILALFARARERGWAATPALVASYLASETLFPMLFEHYFGASFAPVPVLMQIADLGGPMMCTALIMTVCGAIYDGLDAYARREPISRLWSGLAIGALVFSLIYGGFRLSMVDAMVEAAPKLKVGIVQANLTIFDSAQESVRRHVEQTHRLVREDDVDLVIWPESSMHYVIPNEVKSLDQWNGGRVLGLTDLQVPVLFGGIRHEIAPGGRRLDHNTAFLISETSAIIGSYDKTYLLAFGEYLPFSETFPFLHEISPQSGHFTAGTRIDPVVLPAERGAFYRLGVLICYEDLLSSFVRGAVNHGHPNVLINLTNDSWFGETQEPWMHMTLSRFRAIEQRLPLIRATLTGISGFIDPAGRVVDATDIFERTQIVKSVPMVVDPPRTLYRMIGPWPGWIAVIGIVLMCFLLPRRRHSAT